MCCCHGGSGCDSRGRTGRERGAPWAHLPRTYEWAQGKVAFDHRGSRQGAVERGRDRRVGESERPYGVAVLFAVEESGRAGEADARQHVGDRVLCLMMMMLMCRGSIRFAPPLVISEEELETAMGRIEQCLDDFDKVGGYAV